MARTFHLEDTLGQGAFGVVHLARVTDDEGFVQHLAVKMLHAHYSADTDLARRLRDEARLLALLQHEHIVRVHGLSRIDGRLAILMEPIAGVDLSRAQGSPMPPRAAIEVTEAVASALCSAWETVPPGHDEPLRAVHRDIKPSNIMVTARGGVKVMDFGVARARFEHREAQTQSQQFGTARYMAPERWLEGEASAPSDVFSLGITLAELLTGEPVPRPRLSRQSFEEDVGAMVAAVSPEAVRSLIAGMCAFAPEERLTAEEVLAGCRSLEEVVPGPSLRAWAEHWVPEHRRPAGTVEAVALTEELSAETYDVARTGTVELPVAPAEPEPPARRAAAGWWFVGAAVLSLVGAVVWTMSSEGVSATVADTTPRMSEPVVTEVPAPQPVVAPEVAPPVEEPVTNEVVEATVPAAVVPVARVVTPQPAPQPDSPPAAEVPEAIPASTVTFALRPAGLVARTPDGPIQHYTAMRLDHGIHTVDVQGGLGPWRCTVRVDAAPATWRIDDASQTCARIQ